MPHLERLSGTTRDVLYDMSAYRALAFGPLEQAITMNAFARRVRQKTPSATSAHIFAFYNDLPSSPSEADIAQAIQLCTDASRGVPRPVRSHAAHGVMTQMDDSDENPSALP